LKLFLTNSFNGFNLTSFLFCQPSMALQILSEFKKWI
jgi:hypothetical protein